MYLPLNLSSIAQIRLSLRKEAVISDCYISDSGIPIREEYNASNIIKSHCGDSCALCPEK